MYISKSKVFWIIFGIVMAWLVLVNVGWYMWQNSTYAVYKVKGKENANSTWLVPQYTYTDSDGYVFLVKYPNYLSLTGNLAVSMPEDENNGKYVDSLIIWPQTKGKILYGVILYEAVEEDKTKLTALEMYIDKDGNATDESNQEIVKKHKDNIDKLFEKARDYWETIPRND